MLNRSLVRGIKQLMMQKYIVCVNKNAHFYALFLKDSD